MVNALTNALGFLIGAAFNIYALMLAFRFIMQLFRADYYNPLAVFIVKMTDPVLKPLRRIVPSIKSYDTSSLLMIFVVLLLKLLLLKTIQTDHVAVAGRLVGLGLFSYWTTSMIAIADVVHTLFNVFIYSMFVQAILSWFPNPQTDSVRNLLSGITEPIVRPIRKYVPPIGGFDITLLIGILGMFALQMVVSGTLIAPFVAN